MHTFLLTSGEKQGKELKLCNTSYVSALSIIGIVPVYTAVFKEILREVTRTKTRMCFELGMHTCCMKGDSKSG